MINNEKEKLASTESALKDLEQQLEKISSIYKDRTVISIEKTHKNYI